MPSPFPGMDPYLEAPHLWPDVHHSLIAYIREDVQPKLPEGYVAAVQRRMILQPSSRAVFPHLTLLAPSAAPRWLLREPVAAYAVAQEPESLQEDVLEPPAEMYWIETEVQEFPQGYIEIRSIGEGEVVTVIEVISPSNKTPGHGRDSYLQKQDEVLATSVNLVEFDLLRGGLHTLAAPAELLRPAHYRVCIRPGDQRRRFCISDFSVRDPLVPVSIPLHPGKEPVVLDLPGVLARCYEVGSYAAQIDYTQPPDPPLEPEDEAWADAFLREKGLRQEGKPL